MDERVFRKPMPTTPRPEPAPIAPTPVASWESASRLSREIARTAVNFFDAVAANDHKDEMEGFEAYLMTDERAIWAGLKRLVADFKRASGG